MPVLRVSTQEAVDIFIRYRRTLPTALKTLARKIVLDATKRAMENLDGAMGAPASEGTLASRSGNLRRFASAALSVVIEDEKSISAGLPAGQPLSVIGRTQNEGATIHAKDKMLRVPLPAALTGQGVDRLAGFNIKDNRAAAEAEIGGPIFFLKTESGYGILATVKGKRAQRLARAGMVSERNVIPLYLLVTQVTLPPRPWFTNAVTETQKIMGRMAEESVAKWMADGLEKRGSA